MSDKTLKPNWKLVKFGDVVHQIKDRVADIENCGLTEYTRGEHFESGNLHFIGRSKIGDGQHGSAFHMRFKPRDVLYVSRNPQLRKVAVADYEGICANTSYVYRADRENLIQELLPFIMQTEEFVDYTIQHKRGSTNFYLNPSDIEPYEFFLPPLDEQRRIASLLWAADNVISRHQDLLEKVSLLKKSAIYNSTRRSQITEKLKKTGFGELPETWTAEPLGTLLEAVQYGLSMPLHEKGEYPVFRMMNIIDGKMVANDMKYIDLSESEFRNYKANKGDILFNRTNSADLVGKLGIFDLVGDYVFASYLIRLVAKKDLVLPEYLNYYLNSEEGQRRISAFATAGVSQTNINASNLQRVLVPVPPLAEQSQIISQLKQVDDSKQAIIEHIENSQELKKQLIAEFLGK